MEIEAKFRVEEDITFPQLLHLDAIGPFQLTYVNREDDPTK